MTKKEFKERSGYHQYGKQNDNGVKALFFGWKVMGNLSGYKYCVYGRATVVTRKELEDALYNLVFNNEEPTYYINCVVAENNLQLFKVPLVASGLRTLIKYEPV